MGSRSSLALGPAELETAGRFILGDLPVRIEAGSWWAYRPAEGTVTYPSALLAEWAPERVIAALCHEAAEARFTGEDGARLVADWIERMRSRGLSDATLALLVNTVNDFRVNRLHMRRYPGTRGLFRHLYAAGAALESRTDVRRSLADGGGAPLHHQFLDGALYAWTEREWPGLSPPPDLDERPRRALGLVRGAVLRAAEHDRVADLLASLEVHILPAYAQLVADEMAAQAAGAVRASTAPETTDPGQSLADDGGSGAGAGPAATPAGRADLKIGPPGTAPSTGAPEHPGEPPAPAAASVGAGQPGRQSPPRAGLPASETPAVGAQPGGPGTSPGSAREGPDLEVGARRTHLAPIGGEALHASAYARWRHSEGPRIDYEKFDYRATVRRLEPLIRASLYGDGRRPGLADIMHRRRHGTVDPWRRPRQTRAGDSGDVDLEHPDRLVTDPSLAFTKGVRIPRADRQRDFANAILLDISGSMVQRGFPTRKFDRLVDAAVIFVEIHERLKIPYHVVSFSTEAVVHWRYADCRWTSTRIDSPRAYVPPNHSRLFRAIYALDHKDTDDAGALRLAVRDTVSQKGLKSVLVVTDGISSDPAELRRVILDIERRNRDAPEEQRLQVLAFGVGVVRSEFEAAYLPRAHGRPLRACRGVVVDEIGALPVLIRDAIDRRIRAA